MADELAPGAIVQRYRIEKLLGRGGMGCVYKAVHLDTGRECAVKAMHRHVALKADFQKRFLREARAAMAVPHPNIVRIFEVFEHEDAPMLSMEYLEGESLEEMLVREGRIPLDRLARILVRVTSAVGTAHALGIVHRDLKPDNVFISRGDVNDVKILDFGVAKLTATQGAAAETAALTRTGALMGTPYYMSPEQAFGEKKIDQRADIWSLGIILYRCLSGVLPTRGSSFGDVFRAVVSGEFTPIEELVPQLPPDVARLTSRMLAKRADDRPWDLREVHAVLERYAEESAPKFGMAVAPLFDELIAEDEPDPDPAAAAHVAEAAATLALTPSSLRLGASPGRPSQGGTTPSGTIAMSPQDHPVSSGQRPAPLVPRPVSSPEIPPPPLQIRERLESVPTSQGQPPASGRGMWIGVAVAVLLMLAAAIAWRMNG
jgi:eukaryotic-like serine/threonine-protein kinase